MERYCPRRNEWGYACSLKRRTWGHAGASVGGRLYISGGYGISVEDKKALHCYDPEADQWEFKAPMSEPRVLHAMVGAGGRIYALGGRMDHVDRCFDVLAVEYYVPETDQWTSVTPMRAGQSEAGCCLLDRKIYIVGGYNWRLNNVTGLVQVYNTETDEWERDLHFPALLAGPPASTLILPKPISTKQSLLFLRLKSHYITPLLSPLLVPMATGMEFNHPPRSTRPYRTALYLRLQPGEYSCHTGLAPVI